MDNEHARLKLEQEVLAMRKQKAEMEAAIAKAQFEQAEYLRLEAEQARQTKTIKKQMGSSPGPARSGGSVLESPSKASRAGTEKQKDGEGQDNAHLGEDAENAFAAQAAAAGALGGE